MNPGLVVKLRPSGPWRIGPDSGARNRVDVIYHSDSLYSAVTAAMTRLGWLEEWLDATARAGESAVRFSSCFPFQDDLGFIVPPRTLWPPLARGQSGRVRWKSARFVPLGIVQALLAGQVPDETHWTVDGMSECLIPAGQHGPFRTSVRWNAAVDRLTGASERHSAACIEFREGAGLWTIVSFLDEAAYERWGDHVRAAFRLLADTGFGGERSRGWGRAEAPEFIEGVLPDMILPPPVAAEEAVEAIEEVVVAAAPGAIAEAPAVEASPEPALEAEAAPVETAPEAIAEAPAAEAVPEPAPEAPVEAASVEVAPEAIAEAPAVEASPEPAPEAPAEAAPVETTPEAIAEAPAVDAAPEPAPLTASLIAPRSTAPLAVTPEPAPAALEPHWLLGLFTPAADDAVDWSRGNYVVVTRGGRVESPVASGGLKKQLNMIAEGSVVYASSALRGGAPNVAPGGFAHPVFRAGFAVSIPIGGGAA
jgi:CRISPR type III-A-associated RAMP protein Csm4